MASERRTHLPSKNPSAIENSADDRLSFGNVSKTAAWPSGGGGGAVSSDWLMSGETARAGMIDSIAVENSGPLGPLVVDDGVFKARLLRPSQVCASPSFGVRGIRPSVVCFSCVRVFCFLFFTFPGEQFSVATVV